MAAEEITAAAAGSWTPGDRSVRPARDRVRTVLCHRQRHAAPATEQPDALARAARAHRATPAQIRLAWTLHQGPHVLANPGTGKDHVAENIAAGGIRLSAEELADLA